MVDTQKPQASLDGIIQWSTTESLTSDEQSLKNSTCYVFDDNHKRWNMVWNGTTELKSYEVTNAIIFKNCIYSTIIAIYPDQEDEIKSYLDNLDLDHISSLYDLEKMCLSDMIPIIITLYRTFHILKNI